MVLLMGLCSFVCVFPMRFRKYFLLSATTRRSIFPVRANSSVYSICLTFCYHSFLFALRWCDWFWHSWHWTHFKTSRAVSMANVCQSVSLNIFSCNFEQCKCHLCVDCGKYSGSSIEQLVERWNDRRGAMFTIGSPRERSAGKWGGRDRWQARGQRDSY